MDPALVVILAGMWLLTGAVAAALIGPSQRRNKALTPGEAVIVVTARPDDRSFHGVVGRDNGRVLVLYATHLLDEVRDPVPIGEVQLDHERIAFVQRGVAPVDVLAAPQRPKAVPLPDVRRPQRLREAPADPVVAAAADHLRGS